MVLSVREEATRALEEARGAGIIGKSQEAHVIVTADEPTIAALEARGSRELADMFIVSEVTFAFAAGDGQPVRVEVRRAEGDKCPRCWNIRTDIGSDRAHPEVCGRCAKVLAGG